ncbi:MAG: WD40/YVTN/BNR-like repeat-containing protein [Marinifilaceae bacterium]
MMNKLFTFLLAVFLPFLSSGQSTHEVKLEKQNAGLTGSLRGVDVVDGETVWIAGAGGVYSFSCDGGKSWKTGNVPGAEKLDFRDVHAFSAQHVLLMSCGNGSDSRIYQTRDGGKNWKLCYQNSYEKAFFNGIAFWDQQHGILTSDPIDEKPYLLVTQDAGEHWSPLQPSEIPVLKEGEFAFAASGTGIVTKGEQEVWLLTGGLVSRVFYSANRGKTWKAYSTPIVQGTPSEGIYSFCADGEEQAIAVGGSWKRTEETKGNVILSGDGGKTWRRAKGVAGVAFKECVKYLGDNCYIITGPTGTALSKDLGEHWETIDSTPFHAVDYHKESGIGWMVGAGGQVYRLEWQR